MKMSKLNFTLAFFAAFTISGCTVTRFHTPTANVTSYTVAWPWLDTTKSMDKANVKGATNSSSISLTGYSESESVSTNAAYLLKEGNAGFAKGVVEALQKTK